MTLFHLNHFLIFTKAILPLCPQTPITGWKSFYPRDGISLEVQWLRLCTSNAGGAGSIPGWGNKIPHAAWHGQKILKKKESLTFYPRETGSRSLPLPNLLLQLIDKFHHVPLLIPLMLSSSVIHTGNSVRSFLQLKRVEVKNTAIILLTIMIGFTLLP